MEIDNFIIYNIVLLLNYRPRIHKGYPHSLKLSPSPSTVLFVSPFSFPPIKLAIIIIFHLCLAAYFYSKSNWCTSFLFWDINQQPAIE